MSYFHELGQKWQPLAAASIGLVAGTIPIYIGNLFSPHLIAEFGWPASEFALVGLTVVISVIGLPIAGRLADIYGMRLIARSGVILLPLVFVGLAVQPGSFAIFFLLSLVQMLCVSSLVGIVVYNRLLVREFTAARGLALGVAACAPALATAIAAPLLSGFITANGWRAGYFLVAAFIAAGGLLALALIPRDFDDRRPVAASQPRASGDYREIFRDRGFLTLLAAILLCNLQFPMLTSQLNLVLAEAGLDAKTAAAMVSAFALGSILGRVVCGMALDRFPPRIVASICFLFPCVGLVVLASGVGGVALAAAAVVTLGFSVGAEGDIIAYLTSRYFRPGLFSSVLGLLAAAMGASALIGATMLSVNREATGSYVLFLAISAGTMRRLPLVPSPATCPEP